MAVTMKKDRAVSSLQVAEDEAWGRRGGLTDVPFWMGLQLRPEIPPTLLLLLLFAFLLC